MSHPLPHWVERMTISYLRAHGGKAEKHGKTWELSWPNGDNITSAVFAGKDAEEIPTARHLTLEDSRIRGLVMRLPRFAFGQPIPFINLPGLTSEVRGFWSLWRICILTDDWNRRCIMPLFLHDDGRSLLPTARHIWGQLLTITPDIRDYLSGEDAGFAYSKMAGEAESHGKHLYEELLQMHRNRLSQEREKGEYAFAARKRAIERIGLPAVRSHRLAQLEQEEHTWKDNIERKAKVSPEMEPLIIIRIEGNRK